MTDLKHRSYAELVHRLKRLEAHPERSWRIHDEVVAIEDELYRRDMNGEAPVEAPHEDASLIETFGAAAF